MHGANLNHNHDKKGKFTHKHGKRQKHGKKKPRIKAICHRIDNMTVEFKQRGTKRRLLIVQRYRKPIKVKDIDLTPNPEKETYMVLTNKYGDRLEMFGYKNNPKKCFISLNGEVIGADNLNWRRINKGLMKMGKKLGILK